MLKIAINGFGRIGRLTLRAFVEQNRQDMEIVAINDLGSPEINGHLFKYDSVHGIYPKEVTTKEGFLDIGHGSPLKVLSERDPKALPWGDLGVDIVFECTGIFTNREKAALHLEAGAKKVLISAPAENADLTVVYGVNHQEINPNHKIISNASCTTNCLAPVASILHGSIGIEHGYMTTIHSYTGDQNLVDTMHKDPRRARAGALSLIPSTTGAAKAVGLVLPDLKGKLDGTAIRVPTPNVSLVDFKFRPKAPTTTEAINQAMITASNGALKGILGVTDLPLVSQDFNHNPLSSIFDLTQTQVIDGQFCRILSWYDNEWGFSNRMLDVAKLMGD